MNRAWPAALPALAAGWVWYVFEGAASPAHRLTVLIAVFAVALATYVAVTPRTAVRTVLGLGVYAAALLVAGGLTAFEFLVPALDLGLQEITTALSSLNARDGLLIFGPPLAFLFSAVMFCDAAGRAAARLRQKQRRKRADSDLFGKAKFLAREHVRELTRQKGILLGQTGPATPLIAWPLEGSAMTVAPPRTGKGATIALNYLAPSGRGWPGSTVLIDPRGETWCVVARRRRELGRRPILVDPFGVVARHRATAGTHLPEVAGARYNPLDFIRDDEALAARDINVLLDALLTEPRQDGNSSSRHFYESARSIIAGYMAWVRFKAHPRQRTLTELQRLLSLPTAHRKLFEARVAATERFCGGLTHMAIERQRQVGREEAGSNFTTIANQMSFLNYPELAENTRTSDFSPLDLAAGDIDLFVVVPEEMVDHVRGWLRLWVTIPNGVSNLRPLQRDLLIIIDEMPRLGFLKPVMDGYNMAAGRGVHFWCFSQSLQALDATWGPENRKTLSHLAEVLQILGFPRTDTAGAEELSQAIGTTSFESRTESHSGPTQTGQVLRSGQVQESDSIAVVKERLVTADDLMTMGADTQYVVAAPKDIPRDAFRLQHARYWTRRDARALADPNPFVLRKRTALAEQSLTAAD